MNFKRNEMKLERNLQETNGGNLDSHPGLFDRNGNPTGMKCALALLNSN
jgi:hypothetical protein